MTMRQYLTARDALKQGHRNLALQMYASMLMADPHDSLARQGLQQLGVPIPAHTDNRPEQLESGEGASQVSKYRAAEDALRRGDRRFALQIYTSLLIADRSDSTARKGLQKLGLPLPEVPEAIPASFFEPEGDSPGTPAQEAPVPTSVPPTSLSSRSLNPMPIPPLRPRFKQDSLRSWLVIGILLLLLLWLLAAPLIALWLGWFRVASISTSGSNHGLVVSGMERSSERLPPDLLAAGTRTATAQGAVWVLNIPYGVPLNYCATVAEGALQAMPDVTQTKVGPVTATRTPAGVLIGGADQASLSDERRLVLGSAIWRYVEREGKFPAQLADVVPNTLDHLPTEPGSGRNIAVSQLTGEGGWVYQPPAATTIDLWKAIDQSLYPNRPGAQPPTAESAPNRPGSEPPTPESAPNRPFSPITVKASKSQKVMEVWSGDRLLRKYDISGVNDYTPVGTFRVDKRDKLAEKLPDGTPNPFGTRWLRLAVEGDVGNFGIHGSDQPENPNPPLSNGCIRLAHGQLEDFYELVPTGTPVTISA